MTNEPSTGIFNRGPMEEQESVGALGQFDPLILDGTEASGASNHFGVPPTSSQVGFRPPPTQRPPLDTTGLGATSPGDRVTSLLYVTRNLVRPLVGGGPVQIRGDLISPTMTDNGGVQVGLTGGGLNNYSTPFNETTGPQ